MDGIIAKLLSFVRVSRNGANLSDVKADPGGGPNVTAEHYAPPGDDSHPLPGDYAHFASKQGSGRLDALGYIDPKNDQKASAGEKRIYARDASGDLIVEFWLKNDGSAVLSNDNGSVSLGANGTITAQNGSGSIDLASNGNINLNGVIIDPNGDVTVPTSIKVAGVEISLHTHAQGNDSGGNTEQPTGPMT